MGGNAAVKNPPQKGSESASRGQKQGRTMENSKVSNIDCNITILQSDITQLRSPAYSVATYRLLDDDIERVKDAAYVLSKEVKPRKVSQADILRLSIKLFEKMYEKDREAIIEILQAIK